MTKRELIARDREAILALAARYGASQLRLFGSVARGDEEPASDVDFLVQMEAGRSLLDRASLVVALEDLLACRVDVVNERGVKRRFLQGVQPELLPI
ncbi:MAG: nucleotidyltransferase family protein [Chthoniobacterales bacterium]